VPPEAADAARETVGSATNAAASLSAGVARDLLEIAREAFTTAMNMVAGIGSLIFVALILLVVVTLRRRGTPAADADAAMKADKPSAGQLEGEESMAFPAGLVPTELDKARFIGKDH